MLFRSQDTGYNNAPPVGAGVMKVVTTDTNGINENWGSGSPAAGVNADDFQIHWEGQITSDTTQNIRFYAPGDDGIKVSIDNVQIINDWYDKGGGGSASAPVAFTANTPKAFSLWFYENGGGANVWLYWDKFGGWSIVPGSAFSQSSATPEQIAAAQAAATALNSANATLSTDQSVLNAADRKSTRLNSSH